MTQVLDTLWFGRLQELAAQSNDYEWMQEYIRVSHKEQQRFLENEVENPHFTCKLTPLHLPLGDLQSFRQEVAESNTDSVVRTLYLRKIEKQILRMQMFTATVAGDDDAFHETSIEIYGKPKRKYFAYIAARIVAMADIVTDEVSKKAYLRLADLFGKIDTSKAVITADVLPPLVADLSPASAEDVRLVFQEVLDRHEITGWTVVVDESASRKRFSVNPFRKVIHIPSEELLRIRRDKLTLTRARALAEHEVGVHVRRAFEGSHQTLRLLEIGLDGYLRGEEGLASYVQQQIEGATEYYGFDRYLAASLAVGLDGTIRDFRAVFAIMFDYYLLVLPGDPDKLKRAQQAAWEVCLRIFRGSTGLSSGKIFTRDICYFEGNIGTWDLLSQKPHIFESLFIGKFNQLDPLHITSLQALQILPQW